MNQDNPFDDNDIEAPEPEDAPVVVPGEGGAKDLAHVDLAAERVRKSIEGAKRYRNKQEQKRRETLLALVQLHGAEPNSTSIIANAMGVTTPTVRKWLSYYRIDLVALRKSRGVDSKGGSGFQNKPSDNRPLAELGWTILQLFDRLQPLFDRVEAAKGDDGYEEEPVVGARDTRVTWIAWRVFLAAAFGLPQADILVDHDPGKAVNGVQPAYPTYEGIETDVPRGAAAIPAWSTGQEIYRLCTGRTTWPEFQARMVSLIVGRRGGKSYITAIIGIYLACCRSYKLKLGTKGMVMILARDKEQAGVIRGYILAFLKALPDLVLTLQAEPNQKLIELSNGITIEIRAVSESGTRGYTVVAALMDEIAFWPTDVESAKQDKKVLRAIRPAMFGIKNAMIVMLSSPYAQRGVLHEEWRKWYGKDGAKGFVWQADTLSMRPETDEELLDEIRDMYDEDPDSAAAEYGARFRNDLENIFTKTAIDTVSITGRIEQGYVTKHRYRAFVDPSGGSSDSYVLAIAHDEKRTLNGDVVDVPVLDKVVEWKPKFDPEEVSKEIVRYCKNFHITGVTGDAYGGEWPRDPLKKRGIAYTLSDRTRSELYLDFLPMVNSRRCELLCPEHHRHAVNQFSNLERRVGRSGKDSVDHPPGSHDDLANAVAGVMVSKGTGGRDCTW